MKKAHIWIRTRYVLLIVLAMLGAVSAAATPPMEVCEVMARFVGSAGAPNLSVRGLLDVNKYHGGVFLVDAAYRSGCPGGKGSYGPEWDQGIPVKWIDSILHSDPSLGDGQALATIENVLHDPEVNRGFQVIVHVEGHLKLDPWVRFWRTSVGKLLGDAFGVDRSTPVQFVLQRVVQIEGPIKRFGRRLPRTP